MSLLLDALRQAEKNKEAQKSEVNEQESTNKPPDLNNDYDVSADKNKKLIELDVLPEYGLSSEESVSTENFKMEQITDSSSELPETEKNEIDLTPQEIDHSTAKIEQNLSLEELVEDNNSNEDEFDEETIEHTLQSDNRSLLDDSLLADANIKNNDIADENTIDKSYLQQAPLEVTEVKVSELDADAINILQTSKNTDKKTVYWLILFFLIGLIAIAGYLYSLTIPAEQTIPDHGSSAYIIEDPLLVDATNNGNNSQVDSSHFNRPNTEIKQKVESNTGQIDPVLAVMARPEQKKIVSPTQIIRKAKQLQPKAIKPVPAFYIEEDEQRVDYPKKIIIKVKRQQPVIVRNLFKAYSAYRKQDYYQAESLYKQVLRHDKLNIDALLGLAAIAEQFNDIRKAQLLFEKVLNLNANHITAKNALIRLQKGQNPTENESRYKTLIEKFPDNAESYAALANIYASRQQWHQAQEAYFNAVERSPETAYYHFNLAVSLDHLAKKSAAIVYYQKALELSNSSETMFDKAVIEQRIQQLQGK